MDDDDSECRDVYAHFGLAYYMSECVHRGLVNAIVFLSSDPKMTTRPMVEEKYAREENNTMGEIVRKVKPMLPTALHPSIDRALSIRNYLAHAFWFERTHMMLDTGGRHRLIEYLTVVTDQMRELSSALDTVCMGRMGEIGIPSGLFEDIYATVRSQPPDALIDRAIPKTDERLEILQAWLVRRNGNHGALVVSDSRGDLWQLSELGLGWSLLDGPKEDWESFVSLQRYLPAKIVARPKGARPWDYKLHLSTGALLIISRNNEGGVVFQVRGVHLRCR
ncbi:hypothetical protein WMF18_12565 [Sorangium sp. So ce315]|uniref:hypothetical protein n=1 Tax=Sorangium sp. So ce315 TaxID=3133299 RepID=UPI003F63D37C